MYYQLSTYQYQIDLMGINITRCIPVFFIISLLRVSDKTKHLQLLLWFLSLVSGAILAIKKLL